MRLSAKDSVGIAVVAFAALVALVHRSLPRQGLTGGVVARATGRPTVFFDFNVLPADREVAEPHQVVVVRGATIERVGEVGEIDVPDDARRIEGGGSDFLVPGPANTLGTIEPGTLADLVLLEQDPRQSLEAFRHPAGAMIRGRWYGRAEIDGVPAEGGAP